MTLDQVVAKRYRGLTTTRTEELAREIVRENERHLNMTYRFCWNCRCDFCLTTPTQWQRCNIVFEYVAMPSITDTQGNTRYRCHFNVRVEPL